MPMSVKEREAVQRKARKFWDALSNHDRWELGDALVLGSLDWRDWLHDKPQPGFWNAVDELRTNWEIMSGHAGGKKRHGGKSRGLSKRRGETYNQGAPNGWDIFPGSTPRGSTSAWFAGNPHTDNADGPFGNRVAALKHARKVEETYRLAHEVRRLQGR